MLVQILAVPYDSGHRARRMGMGPLHILEHGRALDRLRRIGCHVERQSIEADASFPTEIGTAFELHRRLALAVAEAVRNGALPLVLSGNCNSSLGSVAGLLAADPYQPVGVVWFDGHGDCNTPETFTGSFLDAMGLSTLTGRCWQGLAATVPGFRCLMDESVLLIGGHGMDDGARRTLANSRIANVPTGDILAKGLETALAPALDALDEAGVSRVYVHLDVDVIDAKYARANEFAPEGGLSPGDLFASVETIAARFIIAAGCVASYDPACDREGQILETALRFLELVAVCRRRSQSG